MEITFLVQFCSHGQFRKSLDGIESWFENTGWMNQHGGGRDLTLNLVWIRLSLEVYSKHKKKEFSGDGFTVPYKSLTDEEIDETKRQLELPGVIERYSE